MIVPQYWSESRERRIVGGRQFTVKRFGWSNTSEADAKKHADQRLGDALAALERDKSVRRIDHKISYNGGEGIPIREEVVSRHQDVVISRNAYGALCLNTPNVFFADIDFTLQASLRSYAVGFLLLFLCAVVVAISVQKLLVLVIGMVVAAIFTSSIAGLIHNTGIRLRGGAEKIALNTIKGVSQQNPALHLRIYRTPAGFRVLIMNQVFDPNSDVTLGLLNDLQSDHIYSVMCRNQNCFRARLSPKPWRMGVDRLKPVPGTWPIKEKHLKARYEWIKNYEKISENYAACRYVAHMGSDVVHEHAEQVRKLHDDICKAHQPDLAMA